MEDGGSFDLGGRFAFVADFFSESRKRVLFTGVNLDTFDSMAFNVDDCELVPGVDSAAGFVK